MVLCIAIGGGLHGSFLADPYVGVVLLVLVLLLIAVVCILGVVLCYYVRQNYISQRSVANLGGWVNAAELGITGIIDINNAESLLESMTRTIQVSLRLN